MAEYAVELLQTIGLTAADVTAVGVGVPGVAENVHGMVMRCVNMDWWNIPFRDEMQKYFAQPIVLGNDADLAGYGESICGSSAGTDSSVFITLGTGVGGGLIIFGRPWSGHHSAGGELGHITMQIDGELCTCGRRGCLERYCSATALIRMAKEALAKHPESALWAETGGDPDKLNGKNIFRCAMDGDPAAAGGVRPVYSQPVPCAFFGDLPAGPADHRAGRRAFQGRGVSCLRPFKSASRGYLAFPEVPFADIKIATLGANAGFIGAAMLARQHMEDTK